MQTDKWSDAAATTALRRIPGLDAVLRRCDGLAVPRRLLTRVAREFLDDLRRRVCAGLLDAAGVDRAVDAAELPLRLQQDCERAALPHHCRVVNATGIVLHTGIGRAPLAAAAVAAVADAARYAVVEVDPHTGERNQREVAVAALLRGLLDVEAALVVNNNAAATNLMLTALAHDREVVVSRGELVEIGGGFRMPDVMRQAGCRMVEVGATNRTHLRDFRAALSERTAMLLKVHPSNFRILGFTAQPPLAELVELATAHGLVAADDQGSGLIATTPPAGLEGEPSVQASLAAGVHLVCFSGDKLLGGPQAGILVGREDLVARCRAHPLYRAMRCDKLSLAALEATLRIYRDGDPLAEIPALRALAAPVAVLRANAEDLAARLAVLAPQVVATESFAGSGANPARPLPSFAVALAGGDEVAARLRSGPGTAVFARIDQGRVLLDCRSLIGEDLDEVARLVLSKLAPGTMNHGS